MHRHAVRGFAVLPALAAFMILAVGCGSSGHTSAPKTSTPRTSPAATATSSMSATAAACRKIQETLAVAPVTLGKLAQHPSSAQSKVTAFTTRLKHEAASSGNTALTSAVHRFTRSAQKALGSPQSNPGSVTSHINQLTKGSQKIVTTCSRAAG
jgi:hypothetical protein